MLAFKSLFKKRHTNLNLRSHSFSRGMGIYCKGGYERAILLIFYLQLCSKPMGEAIHPDCAIISQHLRAREICSQTRRSEAQNRSDHSGPQKEHRPINGEICLFSQLSLHHQSKSHTNLSIDVLLHSPLTREPDPKILELLHLRQELFSNLKGTGHLFPVENTGECKTEWDEIGCWLRAKVGQVVNLSCSEVFQHFSSNQGFVYRNCTADGWSEMYPTYEDACHFSDDSEPESETSYLYTFRQVYTVGYATSLISLLTAIVVFAGFRKFRCTRNYIHINLFSSFVLRASAVFIKDAVLFADETLDHCSMSTATCKSAVAFFQFSILANYFWLLVEGMYLQTLLALTFVSQRKYFWWYILIGWGLPSMVLILWVLTRFFYDDRGCWDDNDNVGIWWIIKGPITASLLVNIVIFINVIRILVQKLKSSATAGNSDTGHFMRLAKSTLFLIPLFGMHYTVFAFLPENTGVAARLYIELCLGSFQGFVVALLYCFMNGEVQTELRKWLWRCHNPNHLTPGKRSMTQITIRTRGGMPLSSANISAV